ncbi:hypothetical protein AC792_14745, partial [Arthrobacter sp. RIT-PI-e]
MIGPRTRGLWAGVLLTLALAGCGGGDPAGGPGPPPGGEGGDAPGGPTPQGGAALSAGNDPADKGGGAPRGGGLAPAGAVGETRVPSRAGGLGSFVLS